MFVSVLCATCECGAGGAETSFGHRPDFDETALLRSLVFALDDDERSVPYPRFQQGDNLGLVRLDVQLHGCRDGMAGPLLRLRVFPPAAGGYPRCTARRSDAATSATFVWTATSTSAAALLCVALGAASSVLRSETQACAAITGLMPHSSRWPA